MLLSSWGCWTGDLVFHLVVGWKRPQLLAMCAFPMWKFASLMQANKAVEKVCQQHRGLSFINLTIGVTSITFAVFHWLEATPRSQLYSKGRDYSGCEYGKWGWRRPSQSLPAIVANMEVTEIEMRARRT